MRSSSTLAALLAVVGISTASPLAARDATQPPARYNLQTKVIDNKEKSGSNKDGLYLVSYHTGAGLGAGGLATTPPEQWYGYYENGQQYLTYNESNGPWPLQINYGAYQAWVPTSISVSQDVSPDQRFFFNSSGLQYDSPNNGWLACDWWYTYPELFLLQYGYATDTYPSSCSKVELHPVAI